jgi:Uma2 family endonuclease
MGFDAPPQRTFGGDQYRIRSDLEGRDTERVEMGVPGGLGGEEIARLLNRIGISTGNGHAWTRQRVCVFRHRHEIGRYHDGEWVERGEITLEEAAKINNPASVELTHA